MNHKYSTYLVLIVFFVFAIWNGLAELTSDEIDDVCDENNSVLFKYNGTWGCGNLLDSYVFNITVNNITNIYTNYSLFSNQTTYWSGYSSASQLPVYIPYNQALNTTSNVRFNRTSTGEVIGSGALTGYSSNTYRTNITGAGFNAFTNTFNLNSSVKGDGTGIYSSVGAGIFEMIQPKATIDPVASYGIIARVQTENASQTGMVSGSIAVHGINDGNRTTDVTGAYTLGRNIGSGLAKGYYGYGLSGYTLASGNTLTAIGLDGFCQQSSGICVAVRGLPFTATSRSFGLYSGGNNHFYNGNLYIYNTSTIIEAQNYSNVVASKKGGIWVQGDSEFESTVEFDGILFINTTNVPTCGASLSGAIAYNRSGKFHMGCNSTEWRALY